MNSWLSRFAGSRRLNPGVLALRGAAADAQRSRLPQMAAALAFRTIFSLIPILVVGLVSIRTLMPEEVQKVGSSRVDLQACKLEYSIVSPK